MSDGKRYYWLKLREDFFASKRIKKLRRLAGGDTYTIIYLKMQLKALKTDGVLEYTGVEPSFAEEIALDLDENPEDVKVTLSYLLTSGLAEAPDDISIALPYVWANTGSETASTQRVRDYRERQKALQGKEERPLPATNAERQRAFRAKKRCEEKQHIPMIDDDTNRKRYGGNYYLVCQREQYRCALCGDTHNLCVHHIDGYAEDRPQNNAESKMLLLCRKCHSMVHSGGLEIPEDMLDAIGYNDGVTCNENCNADETQVKRIGNAEKEIEIEKEIDKDTTCFGRVVEAWNSIGLATIRAINPDSSRGKSTKARIAEYGLDEVLRAIENVRNSDFLMGGGERGWQASFDWFIAPSNFVKVLEGTYSNKRAEKHLPVQSNAGKAEMAKYVQKLKERRT